MRILFKIFMNNNDEIKQINTFSSYRCRITFYILLKDRCGLGAPPVHAQTPRSPSTWVDLTELKVYMQDLDCYYLSHIPKSSPWFVERQFFFFFLENIANFFYRHRRNNPA